MPTRSVMLIALFLIFGCAGQSQDRQTENARVKQQASQEIARICALPESQRQAEIDRVKSQSGIAIVCSHSK